MTPLTAMALRATRRCVTGCAIGEVAGLAIGTALGWGTAPTIALAVGLAFLFGYALTGVALLRDGMALRAAVGVAFAAAVPVNRLLIARGRGHAVAHHHSGPHPA